MADIPGISEAYYYAVAAIVAHVGVKPLPTGINAVEAGDWKLAVNASSDPLKHEGIDIAPWDVVAQHKVYFVIAGFGPGGGVIGGGMPEAEFIEQMRALAPEDAPA